MGKEVPTVGKDVPILPADPPFFLFLTLPVLSKIDTSAIFSVCKYWIPLA
jgi:hypothetical protein